MSHWIAEGRTLGRSLRGVHALVVAGGDLAAAGEVARGIAEVQSGERRVVLGDLSGGTARLEALGDDDDPHGLVDAFDYGISIGRISRAVEGKPNLQFAPTGSVAPEYDELLPHPRWPRLVGTFREADQLLVVVLPVGAPKIESIVQVMDGIVLVDALAPARVPPERVIANVLPRAVREQAPARPAAQPPRRQTTVLQAFARPAGYGAGLSILAAFVIFWLWNQPFGDDDRRATTGPLPVGPRPAVPPEDPNRVDPADSGAAVYAVRMMSANTQAGAILKLDEFGTSLPALTFAPVAKSGRTWYEVLTGAYHARGGADSLLTSLRAAGTLDSVSPGVVVRVPYAVLIDSVRKSALSPDYLASLRLRQLPVYALERQAGWVWVVAGAFETRSQADSYAETIRARGLPADVVLRQGRMF